MFDLLDEVVQALRPGGLFLAVVPNSLSPFGGRVRYGDIMHEQSFTPGSIVQICAIVGLEPVAILERGPVVHGLKSAVRWIIWQIIRGSIICWQNRQIIVGEFIHKTCEWGLADWRSDAKGENWL